MAADAPPDTAGGGTQQEKRGGGKFDFAFLSGTAQALTRPRPQPRMKPARTHFVIRPSLRPPPPRAAGAPAQRAAPPVTATATSSYSLPQFPPDADLPDPVRPRFEGLQDTVQEVSSAVRATVDHVGAAFHGALAGLSRQVGAHGVGAGPSRADGPGDDGSGGMLWQRFSRPREQTRPWEAARPRSPAQQADELHEEGMEHERARELLAAVGCFERAAALTPDDIRHAVRASKNWTDMTFVPEGTTDEHARLVNARAIALAAQVTAQAPDRADGYIAQCVAQGRLALFVPEAREMVRLAKEARDAANKAVELAPESDIAHHLIGRWHWEMAGINAFTRAIVRLMFGHALKPGSYAEARDAYARAAALQPARVIHRVELGKCMLKLGDEAAAVREFRAALDLDVEDINAMWTIHDARRLLRRHGPELLDAWEAACPDLAAALTTEADELERLQAQHSARQKEAKKRRDKKAAEHTPPAHALPAHPHGLTAPHPAAAGTAAAH